MSRPTCVILGGPNGSGKSSAYAKLQLDGAWINADEIAKGLTGSDDGRAAAIAAGRAALMKIAEMIETRQSFVFETTLSSQQSINLMSEAKAAGYYVGLYYVALDSVELNIERVQRRVEKGGHGIPEDIIRRRYEGSLQKLSKALRCADEALLLDNSGIEPREIFRVRAGEIVGSDVDRRNPLHRLFEGRVAEAYDLVRVGEAYRSRTSIE
ncbi:zeta toxin family protein [Rhizobium paknamense]|uniref:ABC-type ATPase n=1 Tax=Rhizobium paknamense TaxID=1206817 RepID=A0ABU0IK88_9HYPH|nr:zeta toxin family protein [Rhizobium paknamense]MDQ0457656.1 putative ABC-type ATPase [Rhizobium paknamense]